MAGGHGNHRLHPDPFVLHLADLLAGGRPRLVLDAGLGSGRNATYLAALGHEVIGVDASGRMLQQVHAAQVSSEHALGTGLARSRLERLPFRDGVFDAVVCTHVLETMRNAGIAAAFAEVRRVLRSGGLLLVVTGAREGANPRGGREVEPGTFVFDREEKISVHLADRTEMAHWTKGLAIVARYLLTLEEPRSEPFCAQWAVICQQP